MTEAYVDTEGKVQMVNILTGGNEALNGFVAEKVKQARFQPAQDKDGNPILCKITFPIFVQISRDGYDIYDNLLLKSKKK